MYDKYELLKKLTIYQPDSYFEFAELHNIVNCYIEDKDVLLAVVKYNYWAIAYIDEKYKTKEMISYALQQNYNTLMYMKQTPSNCLEALECNPNAIHLINIISTKSYEDTKNNLISLINKEKLFQSL